MNILCAHCGIPEPVAAGQADMQLPVGDYYQCVACGQLSVVTETGMRRATRAEMAEAAADWHPKRTGLPAMIGFDARG